MLQELQRQSRFIALHVSLATVPVSYTHLDVYKRQEVKSPNNLLAILLVVIAIVFALVIFAMGQVLLQLIKQVMQYRGAAKNTLVLVIASGLMFLSNGAAAQNAAAEASVKTIPNYGGLDATAFWIFVFVIGIEILAILFLLVFIRRMQAELVPPSVKPLSLIHI